MPVLLVIDVSGQAQSAAAIVKGCAAYDDRLKVAGVIVNRVGSERHRRLVVEAIEAMGVPVVGALPRDETSRCPSAISASCRRAKRRRSKRGSRRSPISSRPMSIATAFSRWLADLNLASLALGAGRGSAARTAHRARARRGLLLHLSASRARLAGGRGRDRPLLAARRRAAAVGLRLLLASGRLSGTARRAAGGGRAAFAKVSALRRDAPGAWRMRGLYGAGPEPDGRVRRRPSDGGLCSVSKPVSPSVA